MQLSFLDFLVAPIFLKMLSSWSRLRECGERIRDNRDRWWQRWQERSDREEAEEVAECEREQQLPRNDAWYTRAEQRRVERERRTKERHMLTGRARRFAETFVPPVASPMLSPPSLSPILPTTSLSLPTPSSASFAATMPIPETHSTDLRSPSGHHRRRHSPSLYRFPSAPNPNGRGSVSSRESSAASSPAINGVSPSPMMLPAGEGGLHPPSFSLSSSSSLGLPLSHRRSLSSADIAHALRSALLRPGGDGQQPQQQPALPTINGAGKAQRDRRAQNRLSAVGITREMMMIRDERREGVDEAEDDDDDGSQPHRQRRASERGRGEAARDSDSAEQREREARKKLSV